MASSIQPLTQESRPQCSLPLNDADLSLGNANWSKGLQAMSDWIWSGNLNPIAFPNNLGRYFLQIPAIFEQQLNFSTTLIFDEPSYRNGIQVSGFVDRVVRELVISLIAQRRRCWYSMTHHAVLGYFTGKKHGLSDAEYAAKWSKLTEHGSNAQVYSDLEQQALQFADAFATNPKAYTDQQYQRLRQSLSEYNQAHYSSDDRWLDQLNAARAANRGALAGGLGHLQAQQTAAKAAAAVGTTISPEQNEQKINAQVVELAFLCMQFVALTDVLSALNVPDETFLPDVMQNLLPDEVIARINELNRLGGNGLPALVPNPVEPPLKAILDGSVEVAPSPLKGSRVPLVPYETNMANDRDKGLTVGGVQAGVYGWSFGYHFPGSLVYALMLHPELARYEAPYSLPVLFNEDEWRNGTQTGGYTSRLLKELVYQKIYKTTRSRYGLEHHTMFLYNAFLDLYGVNRPPKPDLTIQQQQSARQAALSRAESAVLYIIDHETAPAGVFSDLEKATLSWAKALLTQPHSAHTLEARLRTELGRENRREIDAGVRFLDTSPALDREAALQRLQDHQIGELAMLIGHMDGLGRALTILRLESEEPVQTIEGQLNPNTGGIKPGLNSAGEAIHTGHFNTRPGLLDMLSYIGVGKAALTMNELMVNPGLNENIKQQLKDGKAPIRVTAHEAMKTAEF
jgi:hypothetical protein